MPEDEAEAGFTEVDEYGELAGAGVFFYGEADELFDGRSGTVFTDGMRRQYTRRFRVVVTTKFVSPVMVCYCPGLPLPFSFYVYKLGDGVPGSFVDLRAVCVSLDAEPEHRDDWQSWIVTARYSTHPSQRPPVTNVNLPNRTFGAQNRPDEERPRLKWGYEQVQLSPFKDLDGFPFLNTANMPFSPPATFEFACPVLTITRNERDVDQATIQRYAYAVNDDLFLGADPGMAQCYPPTAEEFPFGDEAWWRTEIRIRFAPDLEGDDGKKLFTWQPRILDAGLHELSQWSGVGPAPPGGIGEPVPIVGPGAIPVSSPRLLDGEGHVQKKEALNLVGPVFLDFRIRPSINFGDILTLGLTGIPYEGQEVGGP